MNDPFIILILIILFKRSKDSVIFRNYVYNLNRTNKNTVYFKCKTNGCKASLTLDKDLKSIVTLKHIDEHTHELRSY